MRYVTAWVGIVLSALLPAWPAAAQPSEPDQTNCEAALYRTFRTIEMGRPVEIISLQQYPLEDIYTKSYPEQVSQGALLRLQGDATEDVLNSPQFMERLSRMIIRNCPEVGAVSFQMDQTDWEVMYGLIEGSVIAFRCVEPGPEVSLAWGEYACP